MDSNHSAFHVDTAHVGQTEKLVLRGQDLKLSAERNGQSTQPDTDRRKDRVSQYLTFHRKCYTRDILIYQTDDGNVTNATIPR